jgi:hypothetical protein
MVRRSLRGTLSVTKVIRKVRALHAPTVTVHQGQAFVFFIIVPFIAKGGGCHFGRDVATIE